MSEKETPKALTCIETVRQADDPEGFVMMRTTEGVVASLVQPFAQAEAAKFLQFAVQAALRLRHGSRLDELVAFGAGKPKVESVVLRAEGEKWSATVKHEGHETLATFPLGDHEIRHLAGVLSLYLPL